MPEVTLVITANLICKEGSFRAGFPQREFNVGGGRREMGHLRVDDKRARELIEGGFARLAKPAGPAEVKPAGPSETKEIVEKKSFGAPTTGLLTDSPSSSAPGKAAPSSASQAGQVSPPNSAPVRGLRRTRRGARSE